MNAVKGCDNVPNAILDSHGETLREIYQRKSINEFQQIKLDETISELCDCMGKCERIKTTVFPKTYNTVLHLLIYVFAAMLPFSLTDYPIFVELAVNIVVSSSFLLIENTALYKQDPFENRPTDISVTAIARTIEINLKHMTNASEIPQPLQSKGYFLM